MGIPGNWEGEFLVNAVTSGAQYSPVVAALSDGRFAIAYVDYSGSTDFGFTDTSNTAIRVQVFNSDGSSAGVPVQVNAAQTYFQRAPEITATADGGFVVAYSDLSTGWESGDDDIWGEAVRLQRFSGDAVKLGPEIRVNTTVYGDQDYPRLATLDDGRIIVTWDDGYANVDENIHAQLVNPDGSLNGAEFRVNQAIAGSQTGSNVTVLDNGNYVVGWTDASGADGSGARVVARLFNANGSPLTDDFQLNTTTTSDQFGAVLGALDHGWFVAVWTDNSRGVETGCDDTSGYAIRGQVFDADGHALGAEFLVNQATLNGQVQPEVLTLSDGRFIVAYSDTSCGAETGGDDVSYGAIRARVFSATGTPVGDAFLVPETTVGHQNEPQMTELIDGRILFTWTDYSYGVATGFDDGSSAAIRARILDLRTQAVAWTGGAANEQFVGTAWADRLSGGAGADTIGGGDAGDTLAGGRGGDRIAGGSGNDRIAGNLGRDTLAGDGGNDRLLGGGGGDLLDGGWGRDRIDGGVRGDVLIGGGGADILTGGLGRDVFVFRDAGDSGPDPAARDRITDFRPGVDLIDLGRIDADPATAEDDAFVFLRRGAFTGTPGDLRYWRADGETHILADIDGDGRADVEIVLDGRLLLHAEDFFL